MHGDQKFFITYHNATPKIVDELLNMADPMPNIGLDSKQHALRFEEAVAKTATNIYKQKYSTFRDNLPNDAKVQNTYMRNFVENLADAQKLQMAKQVDQEIILIPKEQSTINRFEKFAKLELEFAQQFNNTPITAELEAQYRDIQLFRKKNPEVQTLGDLNPNVTLYGDVLEKLNHGPQVFDPEIPLQTLSNNPNNPDFESS